MTPLPEEATETADVICAGVVQLYPGEEGPIVALRNVELAVRTGEMLAIVGPSGSGKTTLLSLLSGMLRPTAGKVIVAGHDMSRLGDRGISKLRSTELGLLLQEPLHNLIPYATPLDNLTFAQRGARRRGWDVRWDPAELIETFGLERVASRPVYGLSSGEQQKVAIASALAPSPRVLLADEPTCQLDARGRESVIESLSIAHDLSGATIIVVTHDSAVAGALPRALAISHGVIASEGRAGRHLAVVNRDGTVQLPAEVAARFPAGTLFHVSVDDNVVQLRPEESGDQDGVT